MSTPIIRHLPRLFLNHLDAWALTLAIGMVALLLHDAWGPAHLGLPILLAICYWLGFAVNDTFDAPLDALTPAKQRRNFFCLVQLPRRWLLMAFMGIALGLCLGLLPYGLKGMVVAGIGLFILWAYSAPPLRLKQRPGWDLLTHMLFVETFPYAVTIWLLDLPWNRLDTTLVIAFMLASLAAQLEQQIRDYEGDKLREETFTIRVGIPCAARLLKGVTLLLIAHLVIHLLLGTFPLNLVPLGLMLLPALFHRLIRPPAAPRSEWLVRFSVVMGVLYVVGLLWVSGG
jgi:4-hydroxybenzoate polyprenyltransferase